MQTTVQLQKQFFTNGRHITLWIRELEGPPNWRYVLYVNVRTGDDAQKIDAMCAPAYPTIIGLVLQDILDLAPDMEERYALPIRTAVALWEGAHKPHDVINYLKESLP